MAMKFSKKKEIDDLIEYTNRIGKISDDASYRNIEKDKGTDFSYFDVDAGRGEAPNEDSVEHGDMERASNKTAKGIAEEAAGNNNFTYRNDWKKSGVSAELFSTGKKFGSFGVKDENAAKKNHENDANGKTVSNIIDSFETFSDDEIVGKANFISQYSNNPKTLKKLEADYKRYLSGETEKLANSPYTDDEKHNRAVDEAAIELKFFKKYEPLVWSDKDLLSGTISGIFGNRETGKVEMYFGCSNSALKLLYGKPIAYQDWILNDAFSSEITSLGQRAALRMAKDAQDKVFVGKERGDNYQGLDAVAGFSKGGGEANYVATRLGIKSFTIDPGPVINPGNSFDPKKFLAIVPQNRNSHDIASGNTGGALNNIRRVEGAKGLYTLDPKTGVRQGKKGNFMSEIPAMPVPAKGSNGFAVNEHFIDPLKVEESVYDMRGNIEDVKPQFYAHHPELRKKEAANPDSPSYALEKVLKAREDAENPFSKQNWAKNKAESKVKAESEKISNNRTAEDKPKPRTR